MAIEKIDTKIIDWLGKLFIPFARFALFLVYFWFGILKLFNSSPAGPLAHALTAKTIGTQNFSLSFHILGLVECLIGILFLFPKATRIVIPLLIIHLIIVCSPLLLVPNLAWSHFLVPTLDGQYIIKNVIIGALAIGIAAQTKPLKTSRKRQ